jgi:RNA polymerase sigma factor (TIGR02999 family)
MSDPISSEPSEQLTELLREASGGNVDALNRLFPVVYEELKQLARARMRAEREGHTLSATALVHEAYLKLVDQSRVEWRNRAHFFAVASRAMRRILMNHARERRAAKRGGGALQVELEDVNLALADEQLDDLIALDEAIDRLREFNPRGADVVVYRFFGGLSHDEIAEVVGLSAISVRRAWSAARTWLHKELRQAVT